MMDIANKEAAVALYRILQNQGGGMTKRWIFLTLPIWLFMAASADGQPASSDTSPHTVRFIMVDKDVTLEVLDWGGTGRPLVFLPGGGSTGHVFDSFAPKFTAHHHVYAITRRGVGASSAPPPTSTAYSADRLGDDVLAVIAALKLDRPILAGWSIAGTELSSVGSRHPEKIAGLIYLEAGYSYAYYDPAKGNLLVDADEMRNKLGQLISLNGPELIGPTDANVKTLIQELLQTNIPQLTKDLQYWQKTAQTLPTSPPQTGNSPINTAILEGAKRNGKITSPVLAIFAVPHQWPSMGSPAIDAALATEDTAWGTARADEFQAGMPSARVVRIKNADHEVWKSNEADVEREMNTFMDGLPRSN
jgi:pimeloyl-ACP methyl ester carboxylesterase